MGFAISLRGGSMAAKVYCNGTIMAHAFKLSEFGLKLIKAYEGYRTAETTLVSGQRVIGYGHRYLPDDEPMISRKKAELILKEDLEPYEAMVNESIYAPLSQSQFDALVSLSFNIGPRAFLSSNVLHCLNNGRPLEAAAAFDEWRKSVIDGKTYVIDALVRRRTAEKALFLRPVDGVVAAPRNEIPPSSDQDYPRNDEELPTYGRYTDNGVVARAPYEAAQEETIDEDEPVAEQSEFSGEMPANEDGLSPIAVAAAEVSERLEALIADRPDPTAPEVDTAETEPEQNDPIVVDDIEAVEEIKILEDLDTPANDGAHEEYRRPGRNRQPAIRTPDVYITKTTVNGDHDETGGSGGFWVAFLLGASLLAGGAYKWLFSPQTGLDQLSAFLAPVATIVGGMIVFGALYYLIKSLFREDA